ncbi:MAG: DUF3526 domain-containing protein [Sphingopyxis sp.]|jgi:ABC-2 type transport system permease protein|nr:DUF3526 domain-containing protein [Sphingopyxis sp.]
MNPVIRVCRNDVIAMARNRVAMVAIGLTILLSIAAALTSVAHRDANADMRARFQAEADTRFDGQPARHPHRVVHYGHFVFRVPPPLAAFDPGVDAFTGNSIYLEGHRQNSANFGDVRQSSLLARFGTLTPAFILQILAPLVLIFIGFGVVVREREAGTLRQTMAQGLRAPTLVAGKLLALLLAAALLGAPGAGALLWLVGSEGAPVLPAITIALGYLVYLAVWGAVILFVSSRASTSRGALLLLISLWAASAILVPRIAPDVAVAAHPAQTRLETDIAIQRDLRQMGDSHNPDDPHFAAFRQSVLDRYGVDRVEDLPVNYRGLLAIEGERMSSLLFERYADQLAATQRRQSQLALMAAALSPTVALRDLSMRAAGTDLEAHRRFLDQAESYRYGIVQQLNRLQAEALTYTDDSNRNTDADAARRVRIDTNNWQALPDFTFRAADPEAQLRAAGPAALWLLLWLGVAAMLLFATVRTIRRAVA